MAGEWYYTSLMSNRFAPLPQLEHPGDSKVHCNETHVSNLFQYSSHMSLRLVHHQARTGVEFQAIEGFLQPVQASDSLYRLQTAYTGFKQPIQALSLLASTGFNCI